jgi:hypothetical protein
MKMFKVRPFETKTASWWYNERDNIEFSPVYQRKGGIWTTEDKAYLIDSILNEFDIPKFYIADFSYVNTPLNKSKKPYAIIDGRQRFDAIFDFFDGRIVLLDSFQYRDDPSLSLGGLGYKDLKQRYPKIASRLDTFNVSVVSVITDEEAKINELFVRLNRSKPLTGAEIRNAMAGPVPVLIRRLAANPFFSQKIRFQVKRAQDQNTVAKLLLIEFRGEFVDTKKIHLNRFVDEAILAESTDFERAASRAEDVFAQMCNVFVERDPLLASQGQLPVYYWFVRTFWASHGAMLREFLVDFTRRLGTVRNVESEAAHRADPELVKYLTLNRSVNDQGSMAGRFRILEEEFRRFLKQR